MDYYQVSVQCNMLALPGNDGGEWAKREDVERLEAERDELRRKLDALKPKPPECAIDEPGGDEDDWIAWDEAMANYRLIVEGQS